MEKRVRDEAGALFNELGIGTTRRRNYHSTYASQGAYDAVTPYLFAKENVDAFYLEFDDERSGSFEPLAHVAEGKKVVLGLVTTKSPVLEDETTVIARIRHHRPTLPGCRALSAATYTAALNHLLDHKNRTPDLVRNFAADAA